jgi:toxin CcdB
MAQFDVYRNPQPRSRAATPYLLDLQADLLKEMETRVVAPLMREGTIDRTPRLHPIFIVEATRVIMVTERIAAIRRGTLTDRVTSLEGQRYDIINAIDVLWAGV